MLRLDFSESFAALDVVLEIRHGEDRSLIRDGALRRFGSLADMTLVGGELRITLSIREEDGSGECCDEFEVLSAAHMYLCFVTNVLTLIGMFEVARPLTFHRLSTCGKSNKASQVPSYF